MGRTFDNRSLEDAQRQFMAWFCDQARSSEADLIILAGDIWDRATPTPEAVVQLDDALNELAELGIPSILIAGNHDKAARLRFGARRQALGGIHIFAEDERHPTPWAYTDTKGNISAVVVPVPYLDPRRFADAVYRPDGHPIADADPRTHEDVLRSALATGRDRARQSYGEQPFLIAVCHATVIGSEQRESEEGYEIGGIANVDASVFAGYDYAALGHLHTSQEVAGHPRVAYSGSPIPYSYHEEEPKSVRLVELGVAGSFESELLPIPMGRRVKRFSGLTMEELLAPELVEKFREHWVSVELPRSAGIQDSAMPRLRIHYPFITHLQYDSNHDGRAGGSDGPIPSPDPKRSPEQLVADFLDDLRGRGPSPAEALLISQFIEKARTDLRGEREDRGDDVTAP